VTITCGWEFQLPHRRLVACSMECFNGMPMEILGVPGFLAEYPILLDDGHDACTKEHSIPRNVERIGGLDLSGQTGQSGQHAQSNGKRPRFVGVLAQLGQC
jgi:hypothetical protein